MSLSLPNQLSASESDPTQVRSVELFGIVANRDRARDPITSGVGEHRIVQPSGWR
jgi:hypothetical protein